MELKIHEISDGSFDIRDGSWTLIHVHLQPAHPTFDPERTCRMIQSMEWMKDLLEKFISYDPVVECATRTSTHAKKVLDYIEHGDKEEMVKVAIMGDVSNYCGQIPLSIKEIPKSKAIKAGIIDE